VADDTASTAMDLLPAADARAVDGVPDDGNAARRDEADAVFDAINRAVDL
jgi:hypothetical protein